MLSALLTGSCTSVNITRYYHRHQSALDSIQHTYKTAYRIRPFSLEFTDHSFRRVSVEILTDSLKYIYEFGPGEEAALQDSLRKYQLDVPAIDRLITQMRSMHCAWVNKLDYYSLSGEKHLLTYISLWPRVINRPFRNKQYYIIAYFSEPQFFDTRGELMTGRRVRRIRKINAEIYNRISDTVCYTLSDRFR
ncbi:MAG: hypothetical protein P4L51_10890 [Puia sp.]|nr:hypothetical protein [Puia sp.]